MAVLSAGGAIAAATDETGRARIAALLDPAAETQLADNFATHSEIVDLSAEITRLRSETRLLALEKEAMAIKIATLESELGPITGSIPDPAETELEEVPMAVAAETDSPAGVEGDIAATEPKSVRTIDVGSAPLLVERKNAATPPMPEAKPDETGVSAPAAEMMRNDDEDDETDIAALASPAARIIPSPVGQTHFAVQLGMADTMDEVRELWKSISNEHDILIGRLEPAVAIAEEEEKIRLRLLAGPFADAADAIRLCTLLIEHGVDCRAVRSEGQKLVMR